MYTNLFSDQMKIKFVYIGSTQWRYQWYKKPGIHKPYESSVARARGQAAEKEKGDQPRWSGPNLEWRLGEKRKWRVAKKHMFACMWMTYIYIISTYIYILYLKKLYGSDVTIYHIAWTIFPWTWNFEDYFFGWHADGWSCMKQDKLIGPYQGIAIHGWKLHPIQKACIPKRQRDMNLCSIALIRHVLWHFGSDTHLSRSDSSPYEP